MGNSARENTGAFNPIKFGADPTGSVDSSRAFNRLFNIVPDGSRIELQEGTYLLSAPTAWQNKRLEVVGIGRVEFIQAYTGIGPMIQASNAAGSFFENLTFRGADTAKYYCKIYESLKITATRRSALRVVDSNNVDVSRILVTNKLAGIQLDTCESCSVRDCRITGFGELGRAMTDAANFHFAVGINQGRDIVVDHVSVDNIGNGVLVGRYRPDNGTKSIATELKFNSLNLKSCYDNALYLSSADSVYVTNINVNYCNSSGIRSQATNVTVSGGRLFDCGIGIAVQGLEETAWIENKYSAENIAISGVIITGARTAGICLDDRADSGVFTRNVSISGVVIGGVCPSGGICGTADFVSISGGTINNIDGVGIDLRGSQQGYDLRLMLVDATVELVDEGRSLVIVALVGTDLHIRIFDASGEQVVDKAERDLEAGETLTALKDRLNSFFLSGQPSLSREEKQEIIRKATSSAGHARQQSLPIENIVIDGCVVGNALAGFHIKYATKAIVSNIRLSNSVDKSGNFATLSSVSDSDIVSVRSDTGRFSEDRESSGNLIANVEGPEASVTAGTDHRAWLVEL